MPPTTSGVPPGDQEETPQRVRRAAREQFGQTDFFSVSMSAIARAARCSPSAVYQHFGSKQALFLSLCREQEDDDAELLLLLLAAFRHGQDDWLPWVSTLNEQATRWGQVRRSLRVLELTDAAAFEELESRRVEQLERLTSRCSQAGLTPREPMQLTICMLLLGEGLRCLIERRLAQDGVQREAFAQELLGSLKRIAAPA